MYSKHVMDNMEVINSELTGYTKPREDKEKYDLIFGDIKGTVSVILSGPYACFNHNDTLKSFSGQA